MVRSGRTTGWIAILTILLAAGCARSKMVRPQTSVPQMEADRSDVTDRGRAYEVKVGTLDCVIPPGDPGISQLVPCAWEQAKTEMYRRFPSLAEQSAEPAMPRILYHKGQWYNRSQGIMISGDTDQSRVKIAVTSDLDDDFDTMIHEFKHWWVKHAIQKEGQFIGGLWVDLVDSTWKTDCKVTSSTSADRTQDSDRHLP